MNITIILHALFRSVHSHHHDHRSSTINTTITSIRLSMIVTITSHKSSVPSWSTSNVISTITSLVLLKYHSQNSTPLSHFRARFHITTMVPSLPLRTLPTPPSLYKHHHHYHHHHQISAKAITTTTSQIQFLQSRTRKQRFTVATSITTPLAPLTSGCYCCPFSYFTTQFYQSRTPNQCFSPPISPHRYHHHYHTTATTTSTPLICAKAAVVGSPKSLVSKITQLYQNHTLNPRFILPTSPTRPPQAFYHLPGLKLLLSVLPSHYFPNSTPPKTYS